MCTAITYTAKHHYFGRNLDLEYSYHETVTVTPRNYPFLFRQGNRMENHYAMIGMAYVYDDYPLYYDAVNEMGLAMAGLNFPGNAVYQAWTRGKDNIAPFELIPWLLGQCATVAGVRGKLERLQLWKEDFSKDLRVSPLHWLIADKKEAVTLECVAEGIRIYDNPVGVLTNNPPFSYHMQNLQQYRNVTPYPGESGFCDGFKLPACSRGMGGIGLPGDMSSASRFVRAAFLTLNSLGGTSEEEQVSRCFHILGGVEQVKGCVRLPEGAQEMTLYSACCNTDKGIYYYRTYDSSTVRAVCLREEDLDSRRLKLWELNRTPGICYENVRKREA
ncbi:MAG: choloylglycine hydrolase [Lachnospiraceae bacterium]|nr:choloylglycine hydrolase [Lachnospiraceae bacterium]